MTTVKTVDEGIVIQTVKNGGGMYDTNAAWSEETIAECLAIADKYPGQPEFDERHIISALVGAGVDMAYKSSDRYAWEAIKFEDDKVYRWSIPVSSVEAMKELVSFKDSGGKDVSEPISLVGLAMFVACEDYSPVDWERVRFTLRFLIGSGQRRDLLDAFSGIEKTVYVKEPDPE